MRGSHDDSGFIFTMDALLTMTLSVLILSSVSMHHFSYPNMEALNAQRLAHDIINACAQGREYLQSCPLEFPSERTCGNRTLARIAGMYPAYNFFIQYEDPWILGLIPESVDDGLGGDSYAKWYEDNRNAIDSGNINDVLAGQFRQYLGFARLDIVEVPVSARCVVTEPSVNSTNCLQAPYDDPTAIGQWDADKMECHLLAVGFSVDCQGFTFNVTWTEYPSNSSKFEEVIASDAQDPTIRYVSRHGINFFAEDPENPTEEQIAADRALDELVPRLFPNVFPPEMEPPETNPPTPREYAARTVRQALDGADGVGDNARLIIDHVLNLPNGANDIVDDDNPARYIKFQRCFNNTLYDDNPDNDCNNPLSYFCPCLIPENPPPRTLYCVEREITICGLNLDRDQCGDNQTSVFFQTLVCPRISTVKVCVWRE